MISWGVLLRDQRRKSGTATVTLRQPKLQLLYSLGYCIYHLLLHGFCHGGHTFCDPTRKTIAFNGTRVNVNKAWMRSLQSVSAVHNIESQQISPLLLGGVRGGSALQNDFRTLPSSPEF